MANEAVLLYDTETPYSMTVANATGVEKGTLLTLSDPLTAAAVTTSTAACAGIAAGEKIASDGNTKLQVYRSGWFKVTASGAVTVGGLVQFDAENLVVETLAAGDFYAGVALETAANGETFMIELRPGRRGA